MFNLEIATDNDAFADGAGTEIARLLRELANKIEDHSTSATGTMRDYNGTTVASWRLDVD